MTCGEAREKLLLYVGGDLDAEVLQAVQTHLGRCPECARRAAAAERARRSLVSALREREEVAAGPSLWPGIRATLKAEGILQPADRQGASPTAPRPRRARWTLSLAPLAAAAALLLVTQLSGTFRSAGGPQVAPGPAGPVVEVPEVAVTPVAQPAGSLGQPGGTLRRLAPDEVQPLSPFVPARGARAEGSDVSLAGYHGRVR